jgi:beta-N-acetylhexosaminidase
MGVKMTKKFKLYILFLLMLSLFTGCTRLSVNNANPSAGQTSDETKSTETAPASNNDITKTPNITKTPTAAVSPSPTPSPTNKPSPAGESATITREEKAAKILSGMTLREKVGQMFFVRCIKEQALTDIAKYHLGGYILFGDDFKKQTKSSLKTTLSGYQKKSKLPMLIGVDEEGGIVNRLSKYSSFRKYPFKSPQDLYKEGGFGLITNDTKEKAALLKSLGINVNLAPVCDVSTDSKDFIFKRSFGKNANKTSDYVKTVVSQMKKSGIGSTLKHFPGYGNNVDTHTGIAIDERSYEVFLTSDFLPFQAGIKAGADSILVSHNVVKSMDKKYPASLSKKVHQILRDKLGFQGVIMTDDLSMDAIKDYTNDKEAAVLAISAGNDLVVATDYEVQIPAVMAAIKSGVLTKDRIDESVTRILLWKLDLGLIK